MPLLTCPEALALIAEKARTLQPPAQTERVALAAARGRVLALTIEADRDQPPFPRSTRDGYALVAGSAGEAQRLIGAIRAGQQWTGAPLRAGESIEIMTGAPVPAGADAVAMLEHVTLSEVDLRLQAGRSVTPGENIVPQGAEARSGATLLLPGTRITAAEIALAASVGAAVLEVYRRPTAAILSTGDELVQVDETPGPMQIRNSNSHGLAAMVEAYGGTPRVLGAAADTLQSLDAAIAAAQEAEMLLLSGGVSAGKFDFVEEALARRGAEFFFTGVSIQPGKPAVFGWIPPAADRAAQWIFGLPGNPVSTQVTAALFAMPMLRALAGERIGEAMPGPAFANAVLNQDVRVRPGLTRFLPARFESSLSGTSVRPTGWQGSGDLHSNARANCYLVVPPEVDALSAGSVVTLLLREA